MVQLPLRPDVHASITGARAGENASLAGFDDKSLQLQINQGKFATSSVTLYVETTMGDQASFDVEVPVEALSFATPFFSVIARDRPLDEIEIMSIAQLGGVLRVTATPSEPEYYRARSARGDVPLLISKVQLVHWNGSRFVPLADEDAVSNVVTLRVPMAASKLKRGDLLLLRAYPNPRVVGGAGVQTLSVIALR